VLGQQFGAAIIHGHSNTKAIRQKTGGIKPGKKLKKRQADRGFGKRTSERPRERRKNAKKDVGKTVSNKRSGGRPADDKNPTPAGGKNRVKKEKYSPIP
jgi:hypothetical protein